MKRGGPGARCFTAPTGSPNWSAARTVITSAARGAAGSIEPKRRWWFVENSGMVSRRLEASRLDSGRSK
jgi:hypothetical protein